jgi:hypothetical protein
MRRHVDVKVVCDCDFGKGSSGCIMTILYAEAVFFSRSPLPFCGSGSGNARIGIILPDPDPHPEPADPDPEPDRI